MAKIITIQIGEAGKEDLIDLGGDLDHGCCGLEYQKLIEIMEDLGVNLKLGGVHCRLPVTERVKAKICGECSLSPLKKNKHLEKEAIWRRK